MTDFDYRGVRDRILGIQRNERGGFARAVRRPDLTRSERALLLVLIEFAPHISPSMATLEALLETEERAIKRLVRDLEGKGYLTVTRRPGFRSVYEITVPPADAQGGVTPPHGVTPLHPVTPPHGVTPPPPMASPPPPPMASPEADNRSRQESGSLPLTAERAALGPVRGPSMGATEGGTKTTKTAKAKATPLPGTHDLKLHYVETFERHRGTTPEFGKRWSRAMKAFGELVTTHGLDGAKTIVSRALADEYARRIEPWALVDDAVRWLGKRPLSAGKGQLAIQRHGEQLRINSDADSWG